MERMGGRPTDLKKRGGVGAPGEPICRDADDGAARCQHSSRRGGIFRRLPPAAAFATR